MLFKKKRGWEIPESAASSESAFFNRRNLVTAGIVSAAAIGTGAIYWRGGQGAPTPAAQAVAGEGPKAITAAAGDPSASLYPATPNMRYRLDRDMTDEKTATTFNNFYEFGSSKNIWQAAQKLVIRPWQVRFDGLVERERLVDIDDILKQVKLEERLYRHRCVEAWAMAVPWTGFPMRELLDIAKPLSSARYVRMETFKNPDMAPGQRANWYPWPYVEGLTIQEAANEMTLMGTGVFGKPMPPQMGAPIRLVAPWKYGFKSIKSITRFTFTAERPKSFWEDIQGQEYGFWANVNPRVPHPRWSQASEELIGTNGKRVPTQLFNGYGEFVAGLYTDLEKQGEKLWM